MEGLGFGVEEVGVHRGGEVGHAEAVLAPGEDGVHLGDLNVLNAGVSFGGRDALFAMLRSEWCWWDALEKVLIVGAVVDLVLVYLEKVGDGLAEAGNCGGGVVRVLVGLCA